MMAKAAALEWPPLASDQTFPCECEGGRRGDASSDINQRNGKMSDEMRMVMEDNSVRRETPFSRRPENIVGSWRARGKHAKERNK